MDILINVILVCIPLIMLLVGWKYSTPEAESNIPFTSRKFHKLDFNIRESYISSVKSKDVLTQRHIRMENNDNNLFVKFANAVDSADKVELGYEPIITNPLDSTLRYADALTKYESALTWMQEGQYQNICCVCKAMFNGYKNDPVCGNCKCNIKEC